MERTHINTRKPQAATTQWLWIRHALLWKVSTPTFTQKKPTSFPGTYKAHTPKVSYNYLCAQRQQGSVYHLVALNSRHHQGFWGIDYLVLNTVRIKMHYNMLTGRPGWQPKCSSSPCTHGPWGSRHRGIGGSVWGRAGSTELPSRAESVNYNSYLWMRHNLILKLLKFVMLTLKCLTSYNIFHAFVKPIVTSQFNQCWPDWIFLPITQHVSTLYLSISTRLWAK